MKLKFQQRKTDNELEKRQITKSYRILGGHKYYVYYTKLYNGAQKHLEWGRSGWLQFLLGWMLQTSLEKVTLGQIPEKDEGVHRSVA